MREFHAKIYVDWVDVDIKAETPEEARKVAERALQQALGHQVFGIGYGCLDIKIEEKIQQEGHRAL